MTALIRSGDVLDAGLAVLLGATDEASGDAIAAICNDALRDVVGPAVLSALRADPARLPLVAPWLWDLARGLQYQSRHGPAEPSTTVLLACLSCQEMAGADARRLADVIDIAVVCTLDRVLAQVLGPGASGRDPRLNEAAAPWLAGLKLGARIHLVQEMLRLL